jgi:hypothetical protein
LTRPRRSLEIGNYRSDGHHVAGEVSSGPGATGIPFRGERLAASRVFKWVVKKTPKFRHNLGQRFEVARRFLAANAFQFA